MEWRTGTDLYNKISVNPDNRFAFSEVIQNQEEDVHPPLYYLALNIIMSVFAGNFSKWLGISLNLVFSIVTLCAIFYLFFRIDNSNDKYIMSLVAGLAYAVMPCAISNNMLTRMYVLSSMWTVLFACLIVELIRDNDCSRKKYTVITILGAVICFASFLTHYFCLVMAFFLTAFYTIYQLLVIKKNILRLFVLDITLVVSILLGIAAYPASLNHIFRGYRGQETIESLAGSSFFEPLEYFIPVVNQTVFETHLNFAVAIFLIGLVILLAGKMFSSEKTQRRTDLALICFFVLSCVASFCLMSRSALRVGLASIRYFYPIMVIAIPLMFYVVAKGFSMITSRKIVKLATILLGVILMVSPFFETYRNNAVLFLYEEEYEKIQYSVENSENPVIVVYGANAAYISWYVMDQLIPFEKVGFLRYDYIFTDFDDMVIQSADKLIVFMDAGEDVLEKIISMNPKLSEYSLVRHDPFYYVYEIY